MDPPSRTAEAEPGAPLTSRAWILSFRSGRCFKADGSKLSVETLYRSGGRPVVLLAGCGAGRIVLVSDAYPATNAGIPEADNALFLMNALDPARRGGMVIFDETSTRVGMGGPGVVSYLRGAGAQPLLIELAIVSLMALWWAASRVGPPAVRRARPPRGAADYVTGMAILYEKAAMGRRVVSVLGDVLREASRVSGRTAAGVDARREALLARARGLSIRRSVGESDLVKFGRAVHDFLRETLWKREKLGRSARPSGR